MSKHPFLPIDPRRMPLTEFLDVLAIVQPGIFSAATRRNISASITHLQRFLGRAPLVDDLTAPTIAGALSALLAAGSEMGTVYTSRAKMVWLARKAFERGYLTGCPCIQTLPQTHRDRPPWTAGELNRLFGAASHVAGAIEGLPAWHYWPALLLCLLNSGCTAAEALAATPAAYDRRRGTIGLGRFVHVAHALTAEALEKIAGDRERLFPWVLDGGKPPYHMLSREYKTLLWRAGLPMAEDNLFERFRVSFGDRLELLDGLNLRLPFVPREGSPSFVRARDLRRAEALARGDMAPTAAAEPRVLPAAGTVYRITIDSPRNLLTVFDTLYVPLRLVASSKRTLIHYRGSIKLFSNWLGYDATLESLTESRLGEFLAWRLAAGAAIPTVNSNRRDLLTLVTFCWKKRLIDDAQRPRDVPRLREYQRTPKAWSIEQMGRILDAAADQPGHVCGIPSGQFFPALILLFLDTGLRLNAALSLRTEDLDVASGMCLVRAENQKTRKEAVFKLHPATLGELMATKPTERELLFPINGLQLRKRLREILTRAGLPSGSRDMLHKLRRTSATCLAAVLGKAAASEHMGHSSPAVTERFYIDPSLSRTVFAADLIVRPTWRRSPPPADGALGYDPSAA